MTARRAEDDRLRDEAIDEIESASSALRGLGSLIDDVEEIQSPIGLAAITMMIADRLDGALIKLGRDTPSGG